MVTASIKERSRMAIWQLRPTEKPSEHWEGSTYKGEVIVRAPDEREARQHAANEFAAMVRHRPGGDSPFPPWKDPALVSCTEAEDLAYDPEGETEILGPERAVLLASS